MENKEMVLINKMRNKKDREFYYGIMNLHDMRMFVRGYMECEMENHTDTPVVGSLGGFLQYEERVFSDIADGDMTCYEFVRKYSRNDDESFTLFFKLMDEFLLLPRYKKSVPFHFMWHITRVPHITLSGIKRNFERNIDSVFPFYFDFQEFIRKVYASESALSWDSLILNHTKESQSPIDVFMELFEAYLQEHENEIFYY